MNILHRGNDVFNVNPPDSVNGLSVNGSDWLWAATAIFCVSFVSPCSYSQSEFLELTNSCLAISSSFSPFALSPMKANAFSTIYSLSPFSSVASATTLKLLILAGFPSIYTATTIRATSYSTLNMSTGPSHSRLLLWR